MLTAIEYFKQHEFSEPMKKLPIQSANKYLSLLHAKYSVDFTTFCLHLCGLYPLRAFNMVGESIIYTLRGSWWILDEWTDRNVKYITVLSSHGR